MAVATHERTGANTLTLTGVAAPSAYVYSPPGERRTIFGKVEGRMPLGNWLALSPKTINGKSCVVVTAMGETDIPAEILATHQANPNQRVFPVSAEGFID